MRGHHTFQFKNIHYVCMCVCVEVKEYIYGGKRIPNVFFFLEQYKKVEDLLFYQLFLHHATYCNALLIHIISNSQTSNQYQCYYKI